jgi:hypothetical protein
MTKAHKKTKAGMIISHAAMPRASKKVKLAGGLKHHMHRSLEAS